MKNLFLKKEKQNIAIVIYFQEKSSAAYVVQVMQQGIKHEKMAVNINHGVVLRVLKTAALIWIEMEVKQGVLEAVSAMKKLFILCILSADN